MARYTTREPFASTQYQYVPEVLIQLDAFGDYIKMTEELIQKEVVEQIILKSRWYRLRHLE